MRSPLCCIWRECMIMDEEFDARFDEVAGELYHLLQALRDEDWEYWFEKRDVRGKIIRILDYIDSGDDEEIQE